MIDLSDQGHVADEEIPRHLFKFGLIGLNEIIGNKGGIPGGSIIQIIANQKCGKTTLALDLIANAQKEGNLKEIEVKISKKETRKVNALYVDFERSFDKDYAQILGVDTSKLYILKCDYAEESFKITEQFLIEGIQIVVLDSIGMLIPKSEEDKTAEDNEKMAASANLLTRNLKRLIPLADHADALVVLINQYRAELSTFSKTNKKPAGGYFVGYASKLILELARVKNDLEQAEAKVEVFIAKTKFGAEGQKMHFFLEYGKGPDYLEHVLTIAIKYGIIKEATGKRLSYKDLNAHGIEQAKERFPVTEIQNAVMEIVKKKEY